MKKFGVGVKTIFFGTSEFAIPALHTLATSQKLKDAGIKITAVITTPDTKAGRGQKFNPPPIKIEAEKLGLKVLQPQIINLATKDLEESECDLIVLAAYGKILPSRLVNLPKYGALNIHPSLLPAYRGATPLQNAILNGDTQTGVSLIQMDEKIDHGPIIKQEKLEIAPNETYSSLEQKTAQLGAEILEKTLPDWIAGKIKATAQDENKATLTKTIKKHDGKIDWKKSAHEIERQIRAFEKWPGSYCTWRMQNGKEIILKITKASALPAKEEIKNADFKSIIEIFKSDGKIGIGTASGTLVIERVQPAGKKEMGIEEFIRGHKDFINTQLY